jgi:outer membrane protein TolC
LPAAGLGCSRTAYRHKADNDVYALQGERLIDPRWRIPWRPVEPDPRSRMRDVSNPDREPFSPDDPAALQFQISERLHSWRGFQKRIAKRGLKPIEDPGWLAMLPRREDGTVLLNRETAMQLGVIHSRDYQFQVESLYLAALDVSLARFRFQVQPFWREALDFQHSGAPSNESNQVLPVGSAGFNKQFYSGAQLLVDFANNLVWEFNGAGFSSVNSLLTIAFTQPLLRGAFARIVTQPLSLQERSLLYVIREFQRFRRGFYVDLVANNGYLGLLVLVQGIRNAEENLRSLERNLEETEALVKAGFKSLSERDQVALQYQSQQVTILGLEAGLETALDQFRVQQLGLPPDLPITVDEEPLKLFELNDTRIDAIRKVTDRLYLSLLQPDNAPPREELIAANRILLQQMEALVPLLDGAREELVRWRTGLGLIDERGEVPLPEARPEVRGEFEVDLANRINETLLTTEQTLRANVEDARKLLGELEASPGGPEREGQWKRLRVLVGDELRGRIADVFASQTQVRVFLIDLPEVKLTVEQAVAVALANRLDLMNAQAEVADAWRNVEVAANALQAGLSLRYQGILGTDPNFDGILRFDASASLHRIGVQFDAPLVRRAERNAYRAAWIAYQRARRAYMLNHDQVVLQIRIDMRNLELNRRQFEISRQQLVTAVRQVEETEYNLRHETARDTGLTLLLLNSLENLLGAKNQLISNWVQYETFRLSLFRDMDLIDLDARGVWINEHFDPAALSIGVPGLDERRVDPADRAVTPPEPELPPVR